MIRTVLLAIGMALTMPNHAPAQERDHTLPDPGLTPGVSRGLSLEEICETRWGGDKRLVTTAMKQQVFRSYGLPSGNKPVDWCPTDQHGRVFEIDHLRPRCAGGADDIKNLWPQCYSGKWNANMKDRLEQRICRDICDGTLDLGDVPDMLTDWHDAYRQYFPHTGD